MRLYISEIRDIRLFKKSDIGIFTGSRPVLLVLCFDLSRLSSLDYLMPVLKHHKENYVILIGTKMPTSQRALLYEEAVSIAKDYKCIYIEVDMSRS